MRNSSDPLISFSLVETFNPIFLVSRTIDLFKQSARTSFDIAHQDGSDSLIIKIGVNSSLRYE